MNQEEPKRRAVFLDRDGVLNRAIVRNGKPYAPTDVREFEILPGVRAALKELHAQGYLLIVVTNQPDVARGTQTLEALQEMEFHVRSVLPLDDYVTCLHDDSDHCECRKPQPGLILQSALKHGIDVGLSFMIGDRWRDIDAGHNAGCRSILIDYGYAERGPSRPPDARVTNLPQAAQWIADHTSPALTE